MMLNLLGDVVNKISGERRKKVHLLVRDTLFAANLHKVLIIKTF